MKTIYLDIDGVINSLSKNPPRQNTGWEGEWKKEKIMGYTILWSVELVDCLNALAEREDVQIKWLTTWQDQAGEFFSPGTGINGADWDFFSTSENALFAYDYWWKLNAIVQDVEETKPEKVVWIDDELPHRMQAQAWLFENNSTVLGIGPESTHGLTKKHIWQIEQFLA